MGVRGQDKRTLAHEIATLSALSTDLVVSAVAECSASWRGTLSVVRAGTENEGSSPMLEDAGGGGLNKLLAVMCVYVLVVRPRSASSATV